LNVNLTYWKIETDKPAIKWERLELDLLALYRKGTQDENESWKELLLGDLYYFYLTRCLIICLRAIMKKNGEKN